VGLKKTIKNDSIYYFIRLIIFIFNLVPRSVAVALGGRLGNFAYWLFARERRKAISNLGMAFGENLSPEEKDSIARSLFINIGKNAVDVVRFKKHFSREIKPLVEVEGLEHFDAVYKRGRGVIAVTGHIGNFELIPVYMGSLGYKVSVIGRQLYDKRLDRLLVKNREGGGVVNIDTKQSIRKILQLLKEGYALGVLIDTDSMRVRSVFIPAFGRESWTPVGQSILGLRSGAGFVPMACVRAGNRYRIIIKPEVALKPSGDFEKDVYNITKRCTEVWEEIVDEYKDQWIWMHNRWNTRPN